MKEKIKKTEFTAQAVANGYFLADQKLALLTPLLEDKELYTAWNGTAGAGAGAADAMRFTLYSAIITDMRSYLFDKDKRAASVQQIVCSLGNEHVLKVLRKNYAQPSPVEILGEYKHEETKIAIEKQINQYEVDQRQKIFDEKCPIIIEKFNALKSSDLGKRIDSARSKMITHKEINHRNGDRALYTPADLGLKWDDASNLLNECRELIFDCSLIINNTSFKLESFHYGSREAADSFWGIVKNSQDG